MIDPPYSPNLAPSDYHLLRSLQNSYRCKFKFRSGPQNAVGSYFRSENPEVLHFWNVDFTPKMAKGFRSKLHIFGLIKLVLIIRKRRLLFGKICNRTFFEYPLLSLLIVKSIFCTLILGLVYTPVQFLVYTLALGKTSRSTHTYNLLAHTYELKTTFENLIL